jgi:hypothetical protein
VHHYIIQVVRRLLDARVDTNAKNLQGVTALDILEGQALVGNNNDEIWDMLASSDLPRVRSHEVYLISLVLFCIKLEIIFNCASSKNEYDKLNVLLEVVVLLVTTT